MPTKSRVCPCALFVDIAKHGLTGNCHLLSVKGNSVSNGAIVICGISTHFPLFVPLATSTSETFSPRFNTISHVPFLNPPPGPPLRFCSRITGVPHFSVIECGGIPGSVMELRKSVGYVLSKSPSASVSQISMFFPDLKIWS